MNIVDYLVKPFFQYLPTDLAALAAAMVWGQKQHLSSHQYQIWQTTGLLHLLVLSGQNITLLVGFVQVFGKRFDVKFGLIMTIMVALFYLLVFGQEPPIVRASIMAIISALAIFGQTTTPPLLILFLTTILLLIYQPAWLQSLSFQLSIGATAGILGFYPYFQQKYKLRPGLKSMFFISLSAQIFTTPLLLINFRQVSLLTLPLNTVVAFLVEPIMFVGVLLSLTGNWLNFLNPILNLALFGLLYLLNSLVELGYLLSLPFIFRI